MLQSAITSSQRPLQEPEQPERQPVPERRQEPVRQRPVPGQQRLWQHQPEPVQVSEPVRAPAQQPEPERRGQEPVSALPYHRRRA